MQLDIDINRIVYKAWAPTSLQMWMIYKITCILVKALEIHVEQTEIVCMCNIDCIDKVIMAYVL